MNWRERGSERERRWVCWCVGWELSFYTAHLKAGAMLLLTLGSRRQVGCLRSKSRSLDSSEKWQAELTRISDYSLHILSGRWFVPITCSQTAIAKQKRNKQSHPKTKQKKKNIASQGYVFAFGKFTLMHFVSFFLCQKKAWCFQEKMH